jgi:hypothetical protein
VVTSWLGDHLIDRLGAGGGDYDATDLLKEFFAGYPIENLRRLLNSSDERLAKVGAWLASELGVRAAPVLGDVVALLQHDSRYVRFFALDAILGAATPHDGAVIARAIDRLTDSESAVRWKVVGLLSRASVEQLSASVQFLAPPMSALVSWLLRSSAATDTHQIGAALKDGRSLKRFVAVAAAVRVAGKDLAPLKEALSSPDPEVSAIAREEYDRQHRIRAV